MKQYGDKVAVFGIYATALRSKMLNMSSERKSVKWRALNTAIATSPQRRCLCTKVHVIESYRIDIIT